MKSFVGHGASSGMTLYATLGAGLTGLYFAMPAGSKEAHLVYELVAVSGIAAVAIGLRLHRPGDLGWRLILTGLALWAGGDTYWNASPFLTGKEAPFPSAADGLYLVCYVPLIAGVLVLVRGGRPKLGDLVEGAIVGAGATLVVWFAVLEPVARSHSSQLLPKVIATAYPVADNLLLLVVIQLVIARGLRDVALRCLASAFALILVTDIVYARARLDASFTAGSWLDAGYLLFYVLLGCASLSPSIGQLGTTSVAPVAVASRLRLTILATPLLIAPSFVALGGARDPGAAEILAGGTAVISLLVFARLVLVFREREEADRARLEAQEKLAEMAYRDPLTGLANRSALYRAVEIAIGDASRSSHAVAVLFVDLDGFKAVNDRFGHAQGDALLAEVGLRLGSAIRERDLVARHGGDEFVIVMPHLNIEHAGALATSLADRIRRAFADPFEIDGKTLSIGVTTGIGIFPADGRSAQELIDSADRAMYTLKLSINRTLGRGEPVVLRGEQMSRAS